MKTVCLLLGAVAYVHGASVPIVVPADDGAGNLVATNGVQDFAWRYESQALAAAHKPADWNNIDAACDDSGTSSKQSPIDIVTADAVTPTTDAGALTTTMFDTDITGALANTGRVLRWYAIWGTAKPTISGGPLDSTKTYGLSHIDFHFGSTNTKGSEHTMDGSQSPMEMQMVFFDSTFADHTDALASGDPDALATISQLFEIDTTTNAGLTPIETEIANIKDATALKRRKREARQGRQADNTIMDDLSANKLNLVEKVTINIEKIIGMSTIENYYYYDGSMTEPDCTENTKWIINKDMAKVTEAHLTTFRTMTTSSTAGESMADNFRPVQNLQGRTVNLRVSPAASLFNETQLQVLGGTIAGIVAFNAINEALAGSDVAKSLVENPLTEFISNIDLNPFDDASVVQQRSSVEVAPQQVYAPAYPQPVYQGQGYQQYVAPPAPAQ